MDQFSHSQRKIRTKRKRTVFQTVRTSRSNRVEISIRISEDGGCCTLYGYTSASRLLFMRKLSVSAMSVTLFEIDHTGIGYYLICAAAALPVPRRISTYIDLDTLYCVGLLWFDYFIITLFNNIIFLSFLSPVCICRRLSAATIGLHYVKPLSINAQIHVLFVQQYAVNCFIRFLRLVRIQKCFQSPSSELFLFICVRYLIPQPHTVHTRRYTTDVKSFKYRTLFHFFRSASETYWFVVFFFGSIQLSVQRA